MSTAFFPSGMESYNNSSYAPGTAPYATWKGTGPYSYPVAITSGNIRPLTNRDPFNNTFQKFGLPRPLKWQYRKGTTSQTLVTVINPDVPDQYIQVNREVRSSVGSSLIAQTIDQPGSYSVKHNPKDETNESLQMDKDCRTCHGIGLVTSFAPERYLSNNPEPSVCNPILCCNEENKALNRVIYASTNLKKNYFNSTKQYLQNRCQTYEQKAFNFYSKAGLPEAYVALLNGNPTLAAKYKLSKPGDPLSLLNTYYANCYPDTNPSYTQQIGAVNQLFDFINDAGGFTTADIESFLSTTFNSVADLIKFIQTIEGNRVLANDIIYGFLNNPNYAGLLSGPSNPRGCKLTVYKPSNPQFAYEGGVSSSTRTLKLTVDTIGSSIASMRKLKGSGAVINYGGQPFVPFIYKAKAPRCYKGTYHINGNPKTCFSPAENDRMYKPISKLGYQGGNINGTQVYQQDMMGAIM